ncbi:MAG: PEP-CTERM sorting domain-containing protein [Pirellulales bacterium]
MSHLRRIVLWACCVVLLNSSYVAASPYATFDFNNINTWVGTGTNQAALVLDWNTPTGISSFVWGYRWNGAATGEDMLRAIAGAGNYSDTTNGNFVTHGADPRLSFNASVFGFGNFIHGFAFNSPTSGALGYPDSFDWNYYTAAASDTTWSNATTGFGSRTLSNGVWDGYRYAPGFDMNFNPLTSPSLPLAVQPVPEPSTYAVLGVALTVVATLRRRRASTPALPQRV